MTVTPKQKRRASNFYIGCHEIDCHRVPLFRKPLRHLSMSERLERRLRQAFTSISNSASTSGVGVFLSTVQQCLSVTTSIHNTNIFAGPFARWLRSVRRTPLRDGYIYDQWRRSVVTYGVVRVSQVKPSNCFRLHPASMISKH